MTRNVPAEKCVLYLFCGGLCNLLSELPNLCTIPDLIHKFPLLVFIVYMVS